MKLWRNRGKRALALCLVLLLALSGCRGAQKEEPLRIGLLSIDDSLPFFVAEQNGLYAKNGVAVELIPFGSAADKERALEAGELDGDMTDLVVTGLLQKAGLEVQVACVALGATPEEGRFVLLGAPEAGLSSPRELSGVPVAVGNHTLVHYLADRIREQHGLSGEALQEQNMPSLSLRMEALMQGTVRAAVLPDPLAALALQQGAVSLYEDTAASESMSQSVVLFTKQAIEQKPEQIAAALKAYFEAMDYINQNADKPEVKQAREQFCNLPKPVADALPMPHYTPYALPSEQGFADVMDWLVQKGLAEQKYAYDQLVTDRFVSYAAS